MLEVIVSRLGMDPASQTYVVVLQEKAGSRLLPIWIGQPEAESIVREMHNMKSARPLTHDLCKSLILGLGAVLRRVQITHVADKTYFGELHLERDGKVVHIDSRPSDAIAIGLRFAAPIFAAEDLLVDAEEESESDENEQSEETVDDAQSFTLPAENAADASQLNAEQLKKYLEHLRPEDFGKFKL